MLKIRLSRQGKKSQPSYRIIVQEHSAAVKGGKRVEELGFYNPTTDPKEFKIDLERVKYWISVGAQPSDTLASLLKRDGMEGMDKYIAPRDKQRKKKKAKKPEAPAAAPAAEGDAPAEEAPAAPTEEPAKADEKPAEEEPAKEEAPKEEAPAPADDKPAEEPAKEEKSE